MHVKAHVALRRILGLEVLANLRPDLVPRAIDLAREVAPERTEQVAELLGAPVLLGGAPQADAQGQGLGIVHRGALGIDAPQPADMAHPAAPAGPLDDHLVHVVAHGGSANSSISQRRKARYPP